MLFLLLLTIYAGLLCEAKRRPRPKHQPRAAPLGAPVAIPFLTGDFIPDFPSPSLLDQLRPIWTSNAANNSGALETFFDKTTSKWWGNQLFTNDCFRDLEAHPNCTGKNSPARLNDFAQLKKWMRSEECVSDRAAQGAKIGKPNVPAAQLNGDVAKCCQDCIVFGQNVDIYYWPDEKSDESCLDLVGNDVHPVDYGAKTDWQNTTYWACTSTDIVAPNAIFKGMTAFPTEVTTATLTTVGPLKVKVYLEDPYDDRCAADTDPQGLNVDKATPASVPPKTSQASTPAKPAQASAKPSGGVYSVSAYPIRYQNSSAPAHMTGAAPPHVTGGAAKPKNMATTVVSGEYTLYALPP